MRSTDSHMPVDVDQEEESKSFNELVSYWKHVSEKRKPIKEERDPVQKDSEEEEEHVEEESEDEHGMIHPTPIRISSTNPFTISIDSHRTVDRHRDLKKQGKKECVLSCLRNHDSFTK